MLTTGDRNGYYQDFGELHQMAKAFEHGYVYTGEHSRFRKRRHGAATEDIPAHRFVVFAQNHDQVGNRMFGERLGTLVTVEDLKLAATAVMLSPHVPLLFMGEEYAETAPFRYFVSHSDAQLVEAVRRGRAREFVAFSWRGDPPDPQAEETFLTSKLNLELRRQGMHAMLNRYYRELLRLRREVPALAALSKKQMSVTRNDAAQVLFLRRWQEGDEVILVLCFAAAGVQVKTDWPTGCWLKLLDSSGAGWNGPGAASLDEFDSTGSLNLALNPRSAVLYRRRLEN